MSRTIDELDKHIISVAREFFLTQGIRKTEMKDIAQASMIGRSTLYRHFTSKNSIAFYIAADIITELYSTKRDKHFSSGTTGYDKFAWRTKQDMKTMLEYPEKVQFLDEFDQLFTGSYPDTEEAKDYVAFNRNFQAPGMEYFVEGIKDGSIKPCKDPQFQVTLVLNLCLGLAQRIIPRAGHFEEEHGYSREILEGGIELILSAVKN